MNQPDPNDDLLPQSPSEAEIIYWATKTPQERLAHIEKLRRNTYFAEQAKLGNYPTEMPRMRRDIITIIRSKPKQQG